MTINEAVSVQIARMEVWRKFGGYSGVVAGSGDEPHARAAVEAALDDLVAAVQDTLAAAFDPDGQLDRMQDRIEALEATVRDAANELLHASGHCDEWVKQRYILSAERALTALESSASAPPAWWESVTEACELPLGEGYPDCLAPKGHNEHTDGLGHIFDGYERTQRYPGWKASVPLQETNDD